MTHITSHHCTIYCVIEIVVDKHVVSIITHIYIINICVWGGEMGPGKAYFKMLIVNIEIFIFFFIIF